MTVTEVDATAETASVLIEQIHGEVIEHDLLELGLIGGEPLPSNFLSVTRPALSELDMEAREYLKHKMEAAGMTVEEHPLGLIGTYEGEDATLPAILALSHFDSVPQGGPYDGCVGVVGAIESIHAMHELGIKPKRPIKVAALTGEESFRFNFALFGSRGLFHGLTEAELAAHRPNDISIGEALEKLGFDPQDVTHPRFTSNDIAAAVELHVIQDDRLNNEVNLAVVEAIAGPHRFEVTIGKENINIPNTTPGVVYAIDIAGKTGHSGATPMGPEFRADGLLPAGEVLRFCVLLNQHLQKIGNRTHISLGDVRIDGQAMNKIPGQTRLFLKLSGHPEGYEEAIVLLKQFIEEKNHQYLAGVNRFERTPISLTEISVDSAGDFYDVEVMGELFQEGAKIIRKVNLAAFRHREEDVVGTVGTFNIQNGVIKLGLDIRGIDLDSRERAVLEIMEFIKHINSHDDIAVRELAGSGDPTAMNPMLVSIAEHTITTDHIGRYIRTFSPAGHDTQNVVRAGIPGVMLFIASRNGGAAHVPQEYSTPKDLEIGTRALAAMLYRLSAN
jgi:hydantoinase/carbamoylase family amidase